jgi:hypothetical protein
VDAVRGVFWDGVDLDAAARAAFFRRAVFVWAAAAGDFLAPARFALDRFALDGARFLEDFAAAPRLAVERFFTDCFFADCFFVDCFADCFLDPRFATLPPQLPATSSSYESSSREPPAASRDPPAAKINRIDCRRPTDRRWPGPARR